MGPYVVKVLQVLPLIVRVDIFRRMNLMFTLGSHGEYGFGELKMPGQNLAFVNEADQPAVVRATYQIRGRTVAQEFTVRPVPEAQRGTNKVRTAYITLVPLELTGRIVRRVDIVVHLGAFLDEAHSTVELEVYPR